MFNSTHTLVGLVIARTRADEWFSYAAVTAVIASNLPDIEVVAGFAGTPAYLEHHRGITHSIIGIPFLSLLLAVAVYFFSGNFWKTYALILVTMITHPLLDYGNTYGWRPFLPFSGTWYYGDVLFIFDPYIDVTLFAGLLAGSRLKNARKLFAWLSLVLVVAYIGIRVELHQIAKSRMEAFASTTPGVTKWAVFPQILNPFRWDGIAQTENHLLKVDIDATDGVGDEVMRIERGSWTEIVKQASKTKSADVLLRFARFPGIRVEAIPSGYRVIFFDFRFYSEISKTALGAEIKLDQYMHVVGESLSFVQPLR